MSGKFSMDDYVDVAERIGQFYERFPEGSLRTGTPPHIIEAGGKPFIVYHAQAFRTPDDSCPADGWAWEPIPGPTQFTRDSELMNAETAAWGRAIVALGFETKKIASKQEVRNRQSEKAPARPLTEQQAQTIASLITTLAGLRSVPEDEVRKAVEHDAKAPLTGLSEEAAVALIGKMQRWQRNLEAAASSGGDTAPPVAVTPSSAPSSSAPGSSPETPSAGESPQQGTDGSSDDGKLSGSVDDAPAEPLFQPPTGPRGSKRKAAA